MKLILLTAFIGVCTAGRLDHLERSYLPPDNGAKSSGINGNYGSSFELGSSFAQQHGQPQNSFPSASNRYLPPVNGPAKNGATQFGSIKGFGNSYSGAASNQQYSIPSTSYGVPQRFNSFNGQANTQAQFGAPNRQYLTPSPSFNTNVKSAAPSRQYLSPTPNRQYLTPSPSFNTNVKSAAPSRQYLSPNAGSSQNGQQQYRTSTIAQQHQFEAVKSRQYLAPSAVTGRQQYGGSNAGQQQRFGTATTRQYLAPQTTPNRQYLAPQTNLNRQYLAPQASAPQQFGVSNTLQQQRYGAAPSRQYLDPLGGDQPSSQHRFGGSYYGQQQTLGASGRSQYFAPSVNTPERDIHQQYSGSQKDYITPLASGLQKSGISRSQTMIGSISRSYLPSSTNSFEGIQQQPFNERTGYQY